MDVLVLVERRARPDEVAARADAILGRNRPAVELGISVEIAGRGQQERLMRRLARDAERERRQTTRTRGGERFSLALSR